MGVCVCESESVCRCGRVRERRRGKQGCKKRESIEEKEQEDKGRRELVKRM